MLVQPRCVRVTAAKSSREEPKPTPEPARRILGRVGGLSVARQRQLLSQWKAQQTAEPQTPKLRRERPPEQAVASGSVRLHAEVARDARERELARERVTAAAAEAAEARNRRLRTRVLLVDAYNVLNDWPTLAALFEAGQLEAAREGLVAELKGFAHFRGWRTVVVFDAKTSTLKEAQREQVTDMLDVVYSCGGFGTADEFIEKEVGDLMREKEPPLVYVATSDRVSGDVSAGNGAIVIKSSQLLHYVEKCDQEAKEVLRRQHAEPAAKQGRRVISRLPSATSQSLLEMRARLNEEAKQNNRRGGANERKQ